VHTTYHITQYLKKHCTYKKVTFWVPEILDNHRQPHKKVLYSALKVSLSSTIHIINNGEYMKAMAQRHVNAIFANS
jgi:hypothetical protein